MPTFACGCLHEAECAAKEHRGRERCSSTGEIPGPSGLPDGRSLIGGNKGRRPRRLYVRTMRGGRYDRRFWGLECLAVTDRGSSAPVAVSATGGTGPVTGLADEDAALTHMPTAEPPAPRLRPSRSASRTNQYRRAAHQQVINREQLRRTPNAN
jgi:hypothetical protein